MSNKVTLVGDAVEVVERLKESTGQSTSGVIRDALGFYDFARVQAEEGKQICTLRDGEPVAEVVTRFRRK